MIILLFLYDHYYCYYYYSGVTKPILPVAMYDAVYFNIGGDLSLLSNQSCLSDPY